MEESRTGARNATEDLVDGLPPAPIRSEGVIEAEERCDPISQAMLVESEQQVEVDEQPSVEVGFEAECTAQCVERFSDLGLVWFMVSLLV
jgi:hypothetical protein